MRKFYFCSTLVMAYVLLSSSEQVSAQPPATHALIHIANTSNARATVYYRWGDGSWRILVIEKGRRAYFNYPYVGNSQSSPNFYVRLDIDTNGVKIVEHMLTRGASPDDNSSRYGHHYVIKQLEGTDTRYIQAVTGGARVTVTDKNSSKP